MLVLYIFALILVVGLSIGLYVGLKRDSDHVPPNDLKAEEESLNLQSHEVNVVERAKLLRQTYATEFKKKKILFIAYADWGNVGTAFANMIRTYSEWDARSLCLEPHPHKNEFDHDWDLTKARMTDGLSEWLEDGLSVVIWQTEMTNFAPLLFHKYKEQLTTKNWGHILSANIWATFHHDDCFRVTPHVAKQHDFDVFQLVMTSPDIRRLHDARAIPIVARPFHTDLGYAESLWVNGIKSSNKIIVTHSPTNYDFKGTKFIREAMSYIQKKYPYVEFRELGGPAHSPQCLQPQDLFKAWEPVHICIDQFNRRMGGAGITCYESMSKGMVAICTYFNQRPEDWQKAGFDPDDIPIIPLHNVDDQVNEVIRAVEEVLGWGYEGIRKHALHSARWTKNYFEPDVFCDRYIKIFDELYE